MQVVCCLAVSHKPLRNRQTKANSTVNGAFLRSRAIWVLITSTESLTKLLRTYISQWPSPLLIVWWQRVVGAACAASAWESPQDAQSASTSGAEGGGCSQLRARCCLEGEWFCVGGCRAGAHRLALDIKRCGRCVEFLSRPDSEQVASNRKWRDQKGERWTTLASANSSTGT